MCSPLARVPPLRDGAAGQPGSSQRADPARRPAGGGGGSAGRGAAAPGPGPDPEESREHAEDQRHTQTPYARTHTHTHTPAGARDRPLNLASGWIKVKKLKKKRVRGGGWRPRPKQAKAGTKAGSKSKTKEKKDGKIRRRPSLPPDAAPQASDLDIDGRGMKGSKGRSKVSGTPPSRPQTAIFHLPFCPSGCVQILQCGSGSRAHRVRLLSAGGQRVQHGAVRPGADGRGAGPAQQPDTGRPVSQQHNNNHRGQLRPLVFLILLA